jgi:serine protease Do
MKRLFFLSSVAGAPAPRWPGLILAVGLALPACAADAPKIKVDAKPLDRSSQTASYAPVIKRVAPSVVSIYSTMVVKERAWTHPFLDDPVFRRFFGDRLPDSSQRAQTHRYQTLGSGVIVTEDGYILTNNHVIDGADKVEVGLPDGKTTYTARLVGRDPQTEVAVLKIEAKGLPTIPLADSDKLEVGDVVIAIGNPFELGQTVTSGIISAVGRGMGMAQYEDWIQTDAAINSGNSGGALVDTEGRLIGLNTFIIANSGGGNQGVGFAIPVNIARVVLERLVADGRVVRGYLGVGLQALTPGLARQFKLPGEAGALVASVQPGSPAAAAGLKEGDVITVFNGKNVADNRHFRLMVSQTAPKTKVSLKVLRDGEPKTFTVTLGEMPTDAVAGGGAPPVLESEGRGTALDGLELVDVDSRARRQFEIPSAIKGALVMKVPDDSAASAAGLQPGDVILEVDRNRVETAAAALAAGRKARSEQLLLRVWSAGPGGEGGTRFLVLENAPKK